tara:strand:- start:862 stop:1830 length:969 start_codon:yes stop_codon:yes gene_type:complete
MKTFIFIPDTDMNAGLGHYHRCIKYSNFIRRNNIIFLIYKNFKYKDLINKNFYGININYIFFHDLVKTLSFLNFDRKNVVTILDTYKKKKRLINFGKISSTHVNILDYRVKCKGDYIIDHTFNRSRNYHINNSILKVGVDYFPIIETSFSKKKDIILINFGSVKSKKLIKKSLIFLKKINLSKSYKIVIVDQNFLKKDLPKSKMENEIFIFKYVKNINKIYSKTFFSFGACGISLYEKCYFHIPCISKSVARNQITNFKNFYSKACILNFDKVTNLKMSVKKYNYNIFLQQVLEVKEKLKKKFIYEKNKSKLNKIFKNLNEI